MVCVVSSCKKEDVETKESNSSIQHKWNPNENSSYYDKENYPFVLPVDMRPFEYAVYNTDAEYRLLTAFIWFNLKSQDKEKGYFILSLSTNATLVNYGFITKTSSYYDPAIFDFPFIDINYIDIDKNEGDAKIMGCKTRDKESKDKEKFDKWVERKVRNGWLVCQGKDDDGTYWAHAHRCK